MKGAEMFNRWTDGRASGAAPGARRRRKPGRTGARRPGCRGDRHTREPSVSRPCAFGHDAVARLDAVGDHRSRLILVSHRDQTPADRGIARDDIGVRAAGSALALLPWGTTVASLTTSTRSRTPTKPPGHSLLSGLAKVAFSLMVPVVGST